MAEGHREAARSVLDVREHDGTLRMRRTDSQQLLPSKTTAIAARQHTRCPGKDNGCYGLAGPLLVVARGIVIAAVAE